MARLPDGALMQRAAAGLAAAVLDLLGGGYGRRVLLLVGPGDNGGDALWAGARLAARGARGRGAPPRATACTTAGLAALRAAGGRATRDLDDLAPHAPTCWSTASSASAAAPGSARTRWRRSTASRRCPWSRSTCRPASTSTAARLDGPHVRADLTVTFGTHKVAHLVDPACARERRRPPRRPRPRRLGPRSAGGRGAPARRRARPAAAARRRRAQVHPRRGRRPRRLGHLPGCRAARRVRRELRAGRDGPLRRAGCDRRHRAQRAPRGRRRRPGPGLGGGPRRW